MPTAPRERASKVTPREIVINEAVSLLRRFFDERACEKDVMLFGPNIGPSSPLPLKYGLDNIEDRIYNILNESGEIGSGLFDKVSSNGGYIEFAVSDNGMLRLMEGFRLEHPNDGEIAGSFEPGCNAGYIHAALLHTANTAAGGFLIPRGFEARRALWFLMMANTGEQRSMALNACMKALEEHRKNDSLSAGTAAVMAAAVFDLV